MEDIGKLILRIVLGVLILLTAYSSSETASAS
jgi:hypothetical protein